MKYILRYNIKSKYFHFVREMQKEFDSGIDVLNFLKDNETYGWSLYKDMGTFNLMNLMKDNGEEENECSNN